VGFGITSVILRKSLDIEIVQDAATVFDTGENNNGGVGRKKGYRYSSYCDLIHIRRFVGQ
jgi:hypothetical protein